LKECIRIKKLCPICKQFFEVSPSLNRIICCSKKCSFKWRSINLSGKNNKLFGTKISSERILKIKETTKRTMNKPNILNKISKTWFKKGKHFSKNTEFKKGHKWNRKIESKRISNSILSNSRKTKPEIKLENILSKTLPNEYKYTGNGKVMIESFNPDFINCNGQKKIIEVFGRYWHTLPKNKRRDFLRFRIYKKYGYKTLVIWDDELKNIDKVEQTIQEFNNA